MKLVTVCLILATFVTSSLGVSQPIIRNTRAEGCIDGVCGPHCAWDGVKILPGDNLNQPGKCRLLRCTKEFDILITPCPFDMTGEYEWIGEDKTKLYPDCCGTKTKISITQTPNIPITKRT